QGGDRRPVAGAFPKGPCRGRRPRAQGAAVRADEEGRGGRREDPRGRATPEVALRAGAAVDMRRPAFLVRNVDRPMRSGLLILLCLGMSCDAEVRRDAMPETRMPRNTWQCEGTPDYEHA